MMRSGCLERDPSEFDNLVDDGRSVGRARQGAQLRYRPPSSRRMNTRRLSLGQICGKSKNIAPSNATNAPLITSP